MSYSFTYYSENTLIRKSFLQTCWDRGDARYSAGRSLSIISVLDDFKGDAIEAPVLSFASFGP